jgi:hypothetical protein
MGEIMLALHDLLFLCLCRESERAQGSQRPGGTYVLRLHHFFYLTLGIVMRQLGLLSPVPVRLLQLQDLSRCSLQRLAGEVMEAASVAIIAARVGSEPEKLTIQAFCTAVAR